jgi:hypothetical protein
LNDHARVLMLRHRRERAFKFLGAPRANDMNPDAGSLSRRLRLFRQRLRDRERIGIDQQSKARELGTSCQSASSCLPANSALIPLTPVMSVESFGPEASVSPLAQSGSRVRAGDLLP